MSEEVFHAKNRELENEFKVSQRSYGNCRRMLQTCQKDLSAAMEMLKEQGISEPKDAIASWLSTNKVWA